MDTRGSSRAGETQKGSAGLSGAAGGLATPRPPAEITDGDGYDVLDGNARVIRPNGEDVTEQFLRGAEETLRIAPLVIPDLVIFKDHSPSCGVTAIYDGTFTETLRNGIGVTTALLMRHGFKVVSETKT